MPVAGLLFWPLRQWHLHVIVLAAQAALPAFAPSVDEAVGGSESKRQRRQQQQQQSQFCAWTSWTPCSSCSSVLTRYCSCDTTSTATPMPVPTTASSYAGVSTTSRSPGSLCSAGNSQGGGCPTDSASCFYAGPSSSILTLGLALIFLGVVILLWMRLRRGSGPQRAVSARQSAIISALTSCRGRGSADNTMIGAREPPPSYSECINALPPVPTSSPPPAVDNSPPPPPPAYEEAVARFKREVRFSTQRWSEAFPNGGGGDNPAFVAVGTECSAPPEESRSGVVALN